MPKWVKPSLSAYAGGMLTVAWLVPIVAATSMLATALSKQWSGDGGILVSVIAAAAFWPLCGALAIPLTLPRYVNGQSWSDVQDRVTALRVRVDSVPEADRTGPPWLEATRHLEYLEGEISRTNGRPALRWATRTAYLELWSRIHRAEEAFIALASRDELEGLLVREQLRLEGVAEVSPLLTRIIENVEGWLGATDGGGRPERSCAQASGPARPPPPV